MASKTNNLISDNFSANIISKNTLTAFFPSKIFYKNVHSIKVDHLLFFYAPTFPLSSVVLVWTLPSSRSVFYLLLNSSKSQHLFRAQFISSSCKSSPILLSYLRGIGGLSPLYLCSWPNNSYYFMNAYCMLMTAYILSHLGLIIIMLSQFEKWTK